MFPALINKRCHWSVFQIIQASPYQRKSLLGQIFDGRRKIELAVEPRLHRVLVGGRNVREVIGHERTNMAVYHFLRHEFISRGRTRNARQIPANHSHHSQGGHGACPPPGGQRKKGAAGRGGSVRFSQRRPNGPAKIMWRNETKWDGLQCSLEIMLGPVGSRARFAAFDVPLDLDAADQVQLAVDIAVDKLLRFLAAHFGTPFLMILGKASFSRSRALAKRDITVPTGTPDTPAISL